MVRLRDDLFHPFHILGLRLEQPAEVMSPDGFYRSSPTVEMMTEAITKANKPLAHSRQQPHVVVGSNFFLTPCGTVPIMFHLDMPCFLIGFIILAINIKIN